MSGQIRIVHGSFRCVFSWEVAAYLRYRLPREPSPHSERIVSVYFHMGGSRIFERSSLPWVKTA